MNQGIDIAALVDGAEVRIRPHIVETPLERSPGWEELCGVPVWVKLENLQHSGSFKVRGALNKMLALGEGEGERADGVVTASTGNHGAAVAYAGKITGTSVTVFVPDNAARTKLDAIRRAGATIVVHGSDGIEAETRAREVAAREGRPYVSPYNDPLVVGGQGTVGVEILRQLQSVRTIYVAVGGGGLISGVAGYLAAAKPGTRIVGCSPQNSAVMAASVRAGRVLDMASSPTLSDGTAGGVESDTLTFEPCRDLVDEWILVSEREIREALLSFATLHAMEVEGAAGVALAAVAKDERRSPGDQSVVVACGGNVSAEAFDELRVETPTEEVAQ